MLQSLAAAPGEAPPPVRMMLANDELRVVLVTIHMSLRRAIDALSTQGIVDTLAITHVAGRRFGLAAPRIAVAGLNPHAGEGGLFGDEEIQHIANDVIYVPKSPAFLQAVLATLPLQLLAYRIARLRGLNVDQPRNLAKTVTVE